MADSDKTEYTGALGQIARSGQSLAMNCLAACVVLLMLAIVAQVVASRMGTSTLVIFAERWPLFGEGITLNSLTDLQWYLMATIALLPAAHVWMSDGHVRVDFAYRKLPPRVTSLVELLGHTFFTLPFLIMCIPASWQMMLQALARDERSANSGLWDRFLFKGTVPFGLTLLLIVVLLELWPLLWIVLRGRKT